MAAGAQVVEGPDPHRLPEHRLLRERRVRRPAWPRAIYFDKKARRADAARGGASRRHPGEPERSTTRSRTRSAARARRDDRAPTACSTRTRSRRRAVRRPIDAPLPKPEDVRLPGTQRARAPYFVELREAAARSTDYGAGRGVRRRAPRDDDDRPRPPEAARREAIDEVLADPSGPSAALVAIDPRDGRVLAMVGGRSFRESQFNLAVQGERQPGSSFKPFVLAAALDEGISPATTLRVGAAARSRSATSSGRSHNYEGSYLGRIDLLDATTHSDNSVYAQLTRSSGRRRSREMAHRLGVTSPLNDYFAIGLGVEAVNPLEMARAFSTFANGGSRVDGAHPRKPAARGRGARATRREGRRRTRPSRSACSTRTRTRSSTVMLAERRPATAPASAPRSTAGAVAGKTGTTENYGDAWFVGYTPQLAVAVWVGYPNELRPMLTEFDGEPVAGGTFPALIWKAFTEQRAAVPGRAARVLPVAARTCSVRRCRSCTATASWQRRQRQLPHTRAGPLLRRLGPEADGRLQAERGRGPDVVGRSVERAQRALAAQPLDARGDLRARRKPGERLGFVVEQFPRERDALGLRQVKLVARAGRCMASCPPRRADARAGARAKLAKLQLDVRRGGDRPARAGSSLQSVRARASPAGPGMTVSCSSGSVARPRLRKREPASP